MDVLPLGDISKGFMVMNPAVVADFESGRIHKGDTIGFFKPTTLEVYQQGHNRIGDQLNKTIVTDQPWKFRAQMLADMLEVIIFKCSISGYMKVNHNGHDFT
jgi:hypothetical protein